MQPKRVGTVLDLSCPACGFRVFNRRYPKCERCKSALPASLLLSEQERQALLKREEDQLNSELERTRVRRSRAPVHTGASRGSPSGPVATSDWSSASASSDTFTSGDGGVFDGGGASGSFGGDSGGSSGGGSS